MAPIFMADRVPANAKFKTPRRVRLCAPNYVPTLATSDDAPSELRYIASITFFLPNWVMI